MHEITTPSLSRRNFCLLIAILASSEALNSKNAFANSDTPPSKSIIELIKHTKFDSSTVRIGKWMDSILPPKEVSKIIKQAETQITSNSRLPYSKQSINNIISNDYLLNHTVQISGIRFSVFEAALCLTISKHTYNRNSV